MKKFLLTLATAFVATFAMAQEAQEYTVITSVEELNALPDSTMVLFEGIDVVVVEQDFGYYVSSTPCLSDGTTQIGGNVYPVPAKFSAVGLAHTVQSYDGSSYREFYVDSVTQVLVFDQLGELLRYGSQRSNAYVFENSPNLIVKGGTAVVTHTMGDWIFYYTMVNTGYSVQPMYGVMTYPDAEAEFLKGDELTGWVNGGRFMGNYVPTVVTYDESYEEIDHKGGHFAIDPSVMLWADNYEAINITYTSCSVDDLLQGYIAEAQPVRLAAGGTIKSIDGKYYYEGKYKVEEYVDGKWVYIEKTATIEVASRYIDLSQYVDKVCEEYVGGVWDYRNTGDSDRLLITEFISPVDKQASIGSFLRKGSEQYEEEIPTEFTCPLTVTYKFDDGKYKFVLIFADEYGDGIAVDYSDAIYEGNPDYEALKAIQPGDVVTGVKGYAQFNTGSAAPALYASIYDYSTNGAVTFVPTVESTGNEVKSTAVVTVEDMINEWKDCQENGSMTKVANRVVTLLDVQVVDTLDPWGSDVKYLIQGTDTMELSNLWYPDKMNFQVYERNNIIGIADYCRINSNYIYQFMPLSQEHITDATLVPEVTDPAELPQYAGLPVILKNAEILAVSAGYYTDYYLADGTTRAIGLQAAGVFDLKGIYTEDENGGAFTIVSIEAVHGFNTISDLDSYVRYYPEAAGQAYNIFGEAIVTYVDGTNVFVQYMGVSTYGQRMLVGNLFTGVKTSVKPGDAITGMKGVSTPLYADMNENYDYVLYNGARFAVAEDANITVVSSDNKVVYGETVDPAYIEYNATNYSGRAVKLPAGGQFIKEGENYFYEAVYTQIDWEQDPETGEYIEIATEKTARIAVASNMYDFDANLGVTMNDLILGVYNAGNTTDDARVFYVTGTMSKDIMYDNIAAMMADGYLGDESLVQHIVNPVTVTYIHFGDYSCYLFVQDETGALRIDLQNVGTAADVKVGDQITGIKGSTQYSSYYGLYYLNGFNQNGDYALEVTGTAEPIVKDVTIADLLKEADDALNLGVPATLYANNLVRIKFVSYVEDVDQWGDPVKFLVDEQGNRLQLNNRFGYTTYDLMTIVGIVDVAGINYNGLYTIHPRTQEDITNVTAVESVEVNTAIYLDAAYQVVAEGAVEVVIYDVNGRQVGTTDAAGLAEGVYLVRATYADGAVATAKVVR